MTATVLQPAEVAARKSFRSMADIAKKCGKPVLVLRNIQKSMALHVPADGAYSEAYSKFLEKVVALQMLHVHRTAIEELFQKELQIMRLLHFDTLTTSPTWYLDACDSPEAVGLRHTRLFLSGQDLGFHFDGSAMQATFDFGSRDRELFKGAEMGEDVCKLLACYTRQLAAIRESVTAEVPTLRSAMNWASKVFNLQ